MTNKNRMIEMLIIKLFGNVNIDFRFMIPARIDVNDANILFK